MNYLYNGVELPALPEWDKEKYPYAVIAEVYGFGKTYWGLFVMPVKLYWDSVLAYPTVYSTCEGYFAGCHDGVWEDLKFRDVLIREGDPIGFTWSNFDVLDDNGELYQAATDPIPVGTSTFTPDPISMTMGWLVGRRIAGQRGKRKEPIAYLYNGVRLPHIPDSILSKYPYVVIFRVNNPSMPDHGDYYLYGAKKRWVMNDVTSNNSGLPYWDVDIGYYRFRYSVVNDEWSFSAQVDNGFDQTLYILVWANHNVYYLSDNRLAFSASEPIPVYE